MATSDTSQQRERVGFIGLGNMGGPMARNLAQAGFPMTVLDLDPERMAMVEALGAERAGSARELAERSDIFCSVVMNDRQTLDVMLGGDGVLAGAASGSLIILHSTISIATCREVAAAAEPKGVAVIDAAVSGAAERSELGTLSLMVGGDDADVERARPLFEVVGSEIFHMGALGMGQATKQCNNLMSLVNLHVVSEALRLAREVGIDEAKMRQVAEASTGNSWALRNIDEMRALADLYGDGSMDRFGRKDLSLASKLAAAAGVPVPITDFVFDRTKHA
jgi:3-hydroxyisobutyrate dehydrogenase-like beta-hydroxyacid dehydrogenase